MADWFVRVGGKVHGPMDSSKLKQLASARKINEATEVSQSQGGPFVPASKINGLFGSSSRPATPPPPPAPASAPSRAGDNSARASDPPQGLRATGYLAKTLLPGERLVYQGRLHWFIFVRPIFLFAVAIGMFVAGLGNSDGSEEQVKFMLVMVLSAVAVFITALVSLALRLLTYFTSEFAVTNQRVVMKQGFIRRQTLELLLTKVDSLGIDQGILGRILNFGAVQVAVATEKQRFVFLANPLEFRRQVQLMQANA